MNNNKIRGWHKRGYLPHFDCDQVYQFVTFRLFDSVPRDVIEKWKNELNITTKTDMKSKEYIKYQHKILKYEDKGYGQCFLKDDRIFDIVKNALSFFDGKRYDLINWVIMPNHVHILFKPFFGNSLTNIIHSWKSFTANEANKILQRKGNFWMKDYYDRYIRNDEHFQAVVQYIKNNNSKNIGNTTANVQAGSLRSQYKMEQNK
ncbi:MAG: transposase [Candidatus Tenebribacter mawsonii]|nr:transposase [Candidatus Tenebribacter mawsonii]